MQVEREIESDVLVIGGGMAGLFAAIKAKEEGSEVVLVDKNYVSRSGSTCFAEGDYSVFSTEWGHDLASWLDRVRVSGEYLNDPEWTEITLKDSIERYRDLLRMGVRAKEKEGGDILTYTRPGFGPLECCFLGRGWTFLPALRREASKRGVTIVDRVMVTDLILEDGVVAGACGFHTRTAEFYVFPAKAVVLCTGNGTFDMAGAMAPVSFLSYDGIAMAYRAGAEIGGMEFSCVGAAAFVAERDEKARIDVSGRTIHMAPAHYPAWVSYGPHISFNLDNYVDAEGFRVSRLTAPHAIHEGRGPILWVLDAARPEDLEATLRDIRDSRTTFRLERVGIDLAKGGVYAGVLRLESTPGHLIFGGGAGVVSKDKACATSLPGLYAGGDTCYTRAVGASYPAFGFGLRNASVTGARAGKAAALFSWKRGRISIDKERLRRVREYVYGPLERKGGFDPRWVHLQLQNLVTPYYALIIKRGDRLQAFLTIVEFLRDHISPKLLARDAHSLRLCHEARNRILALEMMLRSSLARTESRGIHYREDFPSRVDPYWLALVKIRGEGEMRVFREPIPEDYWPDMSEEYRKRYPMRFPGEDRALCEKD